VVLARGSVIHRFYWISNDPIYFDRTNKGRLNSPDGRYGVLYAARRIDGAFAETFLREPGRTLLPMDMIVRKAAVRLRLHREFKLVRLAGPGLARLGATAEVIHGGLPYDVPQAWSSALKDHPAAFDGISYSARHDDDEECFALFDHTASDMTQVAREEALDQPWFWELLSKYGVGIAP